MSRNTSFPACKLRFFIGDDKGENVFSKRKLTAQVDFQRRKIKKVFHTQKSETVENILRSSIVRYRVASIFGSTLN